MYCIVSCTNMVDTGR